MSLRAPLSSPTRSRHTPMALILMRIFSRSEVHKARSKKSGSLVALKKIIMHNEKDGVSDQICDVKRICQWLIANYLLSSQSLPSVKLSFSSCYHIETS